MLEIKLILLTSDGEVTDADDTVIDVELRDGVDAETVRREITRIMVDALHSHPAVTDATICR